jgi:tRNA pseudouridine38-40 synthase
MGAAFADDSFHPRYNAVSKEYVYVIDDRVYPDPFMRGRAYRLKKALSEDQLRLMNSAASRLTGKHDFSSFMAAGSKVTDTVRTLYKLEIARSTDGCVRITARGDGFLYNMVRILAGTLIDTALGKIELDAIENILSSCDRSLAGHTAPAAGLYLNEVEYAESIAFLAE